MSVFFPERILRCYAVYPAAVVAKMKDADVRTTNQYGDRCLGDKLIE